MGPIGRPAGNQGLLARPAARRSPRPTAVPRRTAGQATRPLGCLGSWEGGPGCLASLRGPEWAKESAPCPPLRPFARLPGGQAGGGRRHADLPACSPGCQGTPDPPPKGGPGVASVARRERAEGRGRFALGGCEGLVAARGRCPQASCPTVRRGKEGEIRAKFGRDSGAGCFLGGRFRGQAPLVGRGLVAWIGWPTCLPPNSAPNRPWRRWARLLALRSRASGAGARLLVVGLGRPAGKLPRPARSRESGATSPPWARSWREGDPGATSGASSGRPSRELAQAPGREYKPSPSPRACLGGCSFPREARLLVVAAEVARPPGKPLAAGRGCSPRGQGTGRSPRVLWGGASPPRAGWAKVGPVAWECGLGEGWSVARVGEGGLGWLLGVGGGRLLGGLGWGRVADGWFADGGAFRSWSPTSGLGGGRPLPEGAKGRFCSVLAAQAVVALQGS